MRVLSMRLFGALSTGCGPSRVGCLYVSSANYLRLSFHAGEHMNTAVLVSDFAANHVMLAIFNCTPPQGKCQVRY